MADPVTVKATPVREGEMVYAVQDRQITLNTAMVRKFFCQEADDMGAYAFMGYCRAHSLDPFAREAYLSYRDGKPVIQVAYTTFMKRAERHKQYKGFKAGLILQKETPETPDMDPEAVVAGIVPKPLAAIQGEFIIPGWVLLGGWALVNRKDRTSDPIVATVALTDYVSTKQNGEPMFLWRSKKATMIRKTAIAHGFQNAFPDEVGDMRIPEESDDEKRAGDTKAITQAEVDAAQPKALPPHMENLFDRLGMNKGGRVVFLAQRAGKPSDDVLAELEALVAALPEPKAELPGFAQPGEVYERAAAQAEDAVIVPTKAEPKATGLLALLMLALSHSRAQSFEECPWAYRETKIRKVLTLRPDPLEFGSLIHAAIEAYVGHLMFHKLEMAPGSAAAVWNDFAAAQKTPIPSRMYTELRDLLIKFAGTFRLDLDRVWKPEAGLAVDSERRPVGFWDARARVRGKCDLILTDGADAWVEDWKSARFVHRDKDLAEDTQARTYAMLVMALLPDISAVTVRFRYIRYDYVASATFTRRDADLVWARWQEVGGRMDAAYARLNDEKVWAPTPGWQCQNCPVIQRCPLAIRAEAPNLGMVTTAEEAKNTADLALVYDAASKNLKEGLRKWVDTRGPVTVGGMTFDAYKEESYEYSTDRVIGLAKKHFIEPSTVLKVDTEALKKISRKEKPFYLDVCAERQDKCRLVFKAKKAVPELPEGPPENETEAGPPVTGAQA